MNARLAPLIFALLLLLSSAHAASPLTFLAGASYAGQPPVLVPFAAGHMARVGDAFAYDMATDWAPGNTNTLTLTLDPRLEWTTIGASTCAGDDHRQVCAPHGALGPDRVWAWVRVATRGDGAPLTTTAAYGDVEQTISIPFAPAQSVFLPLVGT